MLLKEHPIKADTRRYSLADQAKALALILREEFGVPFAFYDATTGEAVWGRDSGQGDKETRRQGDKETQSSAVSSGHPVTLSPCHPVTLSASEITALAAEGRPVVTALPEGRYQLTLLLYESNKPVLVASGTVNGDTLLGESEPAASARLVTTLAYAAGSDSCKVSPFCAKCPHFSSRSGCKRSRIACA